MKPERHQHTIDRQEWRIGLQDWEVRMPRWLPDSDLVSPMAALAAGTALVFGGLVGAALTPFVGPGGCGIGSIAIVAGAMSIAIGTMPRYARVRGPELVLGITPTHLEIGADWPYVPADRLTATLAGLGWQEAGGRRIPWAELRGVRLSQDKRFFELMQTNRQILRLSVAGSRRYDKTLARLASELDEHCRRVASGHAPAELESLRH